MTDLQHAASSNKNEIARRISALSPEKRRLLEARLENQGLAADVGMPRKAPLSFSQERIYKLAQGDPKSNFFVSIARIEIPAEVNRQMLRAALDFVIQRHESLRSGLAVEQGRPLLVLRDTLPELTILENPSKEYLEQQIAETVANIRALAPTLFHILVVTRPGKPSEVIIIHHAILLDGPSLAIVRHELLTSCLAQAQECPPDLAPVRMRPADYVREQRSRLQGARIEQLVDRWRHLEVAPVLALHTDRPRVPKLLPDVAQCGWSFSGRRTQDVKEAAAGLGVRATALWLAATSIVLSRFTRQSQIVLGVQVSNRVKPEMRTFVGVAAGVVPVSLDLAGDPSFRDLVGRADADLATAATAEEFPHEKMAQELRLQRSDRQHPIFQVLLAMRSELNEPETSAEQHQVNRLYAHDLAWFRSGSVHFDLALAVDDATRFSGSQVLYDTHLFEEDSVRAIAQSLDVVLETAIKQLDEPQSKLPLVSPVNEITHPPVQPPMFASTIHGLFERRVEMGPNRIALQGDETLSYAGLNARANRLGRMLLAHGIHRGEVVGVCVNRSTDLIVAFLAILKAGGIYLPLDPLYPPERLAFMLQDSGASLLLHRVSQPEKVPSGCEVVNLATLDASLYSDSNLDVGVRSRDAAYLMYTSGSTGSPKGVMVPHVGVCHVADAQIEKFGLTADDQILQFASPSFDASIFELVMAPRCGGTLHLACAEDLMPGPHLVHLLKERRITAITMPPSALAAVPPIEFSDLRIVISAGESCPAELVARWAPNRRFFNAYGPTESSIWSTVAECKPDRAPSIGMPLPHVFVRVVDDRLRPVPVGAPGELLVGGPGVALGYHNRPELSAERFLEPQDPRNLDGRWYRTGDLVRCDCTGTLWHLGRIDRQVKVRGFRIELGEIESCLLELPGVRNAAVEVDQNNLVAYYVSEPPIEGAVLQRALENRLPRHMIPAAFVALKVMPLGANGKLDRSLLQRQSRPSMAELQPPRTATEAVLLDIWKSVLKIDKLGIEDNFFALGGHSLLAASVLSRAASVLGRELPLRVMFRSPSIAQLAQIFDSEEMLSAEKAQ